MSVAGVSRLPVPGGSSPVGRRQRALPPPRCHSAAPRVSRADTLHFTMQSEKLGVGDGGLGSEVLCAESKQKVNGNVAQPWFSRCFYPVFMESSLGRVTAGTAAFSKLHPNPADSPEPGKNPCRHPAKCLQTWAQTQLRLMTMDAAHDADIRRPRDPGCQVETLTL